LDTINHQIIYCHKEKTIISDHLLINEEPLSIFIHNQPYSVIMRTPGDELAHTAGLCLGEGIVDSPKDFVSIDFIKEIDPDSVSVFLTSSKKERILDHLEQRGLVSQSSCNICGKEQVNKITQAIPPLADNSCINYSKALHCLEMLDSQQPLRKKTRASHGAAIYDLTFKLLAVAEDAGRHNALDKAIGKLFLSGILHSASLLILSSRISFELVQKAGRAQIPIIMSISRPTALAVKLANKLKITLACLAKGSGIYIYTHDYRLIL